jgi:hypothetical protein
MKYFISKKIRASVERNADGTLKLTDLSGKIPQPLANAGALIMSFGSIDGFLARCVDEAQYKAFLENQAYLASPEYKAQREAQRAAAAERQRVATAEKNAAIKAKYDALLAQNNGVIPTTAENVAIVLRYLNTRNWGGWELPKMTIGYTCSQYDCDGKQASAMKLDKAIPDGYDGKSDKFCVGAPRGYLNKYTRI